MAAEFAAVYVCDENYHDLTEASIASLLLNVTHPIDIFLFQVQYSRSFSHEYAEFASRRGSEVFVREIVQSEVGRFDGFPLYSHISNVTLMKAYAIDQIGHKYDRVVYIDGDVLILKAVDFVGLPSFSSIFAAEYDYAAYAPFDSRDIINFSRNRESAPEYFNAGLLVINCSAWYKANAAARFDESMRAHAEACPYFTTADGTPHPECRAADQCAFNMLADGDWLPFALGWNVQQVARYVGRPWRHASIRHYTGHRKFYPGYNRFRGGDEVRLLREVESTFSREYLGDRVFDAGLSQRLDLLRFRKFAAEVRVALESIETRRHVKRKKLVHED